MQISYADESWGANYWFSPVIEAHLSLNQRLDWFYELLSKLKKEYPDQKEFKAHYVIDLMARMDSSTRETVWKTLQDVIIIIQDPRELAKEMGLFILPDGSLKFEYKGNDFIVKKGSPEFDKLNRFLQGEVSKSILLYSPLAKIDSLIGRLSLIPLKKDLFTPDNILSLIKKKDSRKRVMSVVKLGVRLCSAFYDVIDPDVKREVLEQIRQYESAGLVTFSDFARNLLMKAISSTRYFDEGHKLSVDIIRECFDVIYENLKYYSGEEFTKGDVNELDSKEVIELQATDWACGIARVIYEKEGLEGLKRKFRCIIFSGGIVQK